MITIRVISDGGGYAANHLIYPDYKDKTAEEVEGQWFGKAAEKLGVEGRVDLLQFDHMRLGLHPETGEPLRARITPSLTSRNLYDFTISAPKSFSVMGLVVGDYYLVNAHELAVTAALTYLESIAETRVRVDGQNGSRKTGNILAAVYHHDTSRSLDPQIHTHCVMANMTRDEVEGRWKALEARPMFDNLALATEVYRNVLANEARKLGYEIESFRDAYKNLGFELKGVPKDIRDHYSQRSKDRDEAIAEFRKEKGRQPTKREIAVLVRETREDKLQEIETAKVRQLQRQRMVVMDWPLLEGVRSAARKRGPIQPTITVPGALAAAREHVFSRMSVASRSEVLTEALRFGRGHINHELLPGFLDHQIREGLFIESGNLLTTRDTLAREQSMIDAVNNGQGKFGAIGKAWSTAEATEDIRAVVNALLDSRDRVVGLQGAPGSGKNEAMFAIWMSARAEGHHVFTLSPSQAVSDLHRKDGLRDVMTMDEFIDKHFDRTSRTWREPSDTKRVAILDEAGLVGSKRMDEFLKFTEDLGCRVVLVGDAKLMKSTEAGDAFKILQRDSMLKVFSLFGVHRQIGRYRDAIRAFRKNPNEGFEKFKKMGVFNEVKIGKLYAAAAKEYAKLAPVMGKKGRSVMAVAPTPEDAAALTYEIRKQLKANQKIAWGRNRAVLRPARMSAEEKRDLTLYRRGMYLVFHKGTKHAKRGEVFRVKGIKDGKIIATRGLLRKIALTKKQAKCFDVFERVKIQVAKGDKLQLWSNGKSREGRLFSFESKFRSGEVVTVRGFDALCRITTTDGRTLPKDFKHFDHGYVFTPRGAQGREAENVVVVAEKMNRESFYTAVSRGRQGLAVFSTDLAGLAKSVNVDWDRMTARELQAEKSREHAERQAKGAEKEIGQSEGTAQRYA